MWDSGTERDYALAWICLQEGGSSCYQLAAAVAVQLCCPAKILGNNVRPVQLLMITATL